MKCLKKMIKTVKQIQIMKYNSWLFLIMVCLLGIAPKTVAQPFSESRTYQKSFSVNPEMNLDIKNKYGRVHIAESNNDTLYIEVEITATASRSSRLKKLMDGISIDLNSTNYLVIAETEFNRGNINLIEGIRSFTNNLISSDSKLEIDYYIEAPSYIDINIDNRYGDIFLESINADLNIKLLNGALKAEDLWGENRFDLNFCIASFTSLKRSEITLAYSELQIDRADKISITSSSSKINIKEVESLKCDSRRDRFFITGLSKIEGTSYFTDFNIDIVREDLNLNTRYGTINVDYIPSAFNFISVESAYTGVHLYFDITASFNFDAKLSNCLTEIPVHWILEEKALDKENKDYLYFGNIGEKKPTGQTVLKLTRGKLILDQK